MAEINAIKYFNAVNATLFTSGLLCLLPVVFSHLIVPVTCWQLLGYFHFNIVGGGGHRQCAHLCVRARVSVCWCVRTCLYVRVCASGWNSAVRDTESRGEI